MIKYYHMLKEIKMEIDSPLIGPTFRVTKSVFFSLGFNCKKNEWTYQVKDALYDLIKEIKRKNVDKTK